MRLAATLVLLALAAPLSAQLTPEQRQQREDAEFARNYNQRLNSELERRALEGDASAYGGPAGCSVDRIGTGGCSYNSYSRPWRSPAARATHWAWLQSEPAAPRSLRKAGGRGLWAAAKTENILTVASPIGGKDRKLLLRTTIEASGEGAAWSAEGEASGDTQERYFVKVPALDPGQYTITIDVYDPEHPDTPYSTSTTPLKIS
jgi:hypothetical protein